MSCRATGRSNGAFHDEPLPERRQRARTGQGLDRVAGVIAPAREPVREPLASHLGFRSGRYLPEARQKSVTARWAYVPCSISKMAISQSA